MPTVARIGPYRFFFYSNERSESAHVHVQRERAVAKFWLRPLVLEFSSGFPGHEIRRLESLVAENSERFGEAWREFFTS